MNFTDQNFEKEVIQSKEPVLVDFWAPWCGPCKMLGPVIDEVASEYEGKPVKIGKCNIEENEETAQKYQIMSIPTMLFFKEGEIQEQMMGVKTKEEIKETIDKLM